MAHGTPSIVADNTSIPEVCGGAAVACDPFDLGSITVAVRTVLRAPPAAPELRGQLATVAARQRADLTRLVDILCCRNAAATPATPACHSRAA
jgi:glycosyltransferase involved in cell wall biosynthesis